MGRHVWVCLGASCRRSGSPELLEQLKQALAEEEDVEVRRSLCCGVCAVAPNIVVMPERLWYSYVIPASVEHVAEAIRQGEALPGLAHHVRPLIRDAVFHTFEKDGEFYRHDGSRAATAPVGATDADAEDGAWGRTPGGRKPGTVVAPAAAGDMHRED